MEVDIMKNTQWNPAITIDDPATGTLRTVKTVRQANTILHRSWPETGGSRYHVAEIACEKALHGEIKVEAARKAFIAAVIEAHLHLS
jgi:hypothetical protein